MGSGDGYGGGGGQGQHGPEARLWEIDLPAFIERCLSSSINDLQALPFINDLFKVRCSCCRADVVTVSCHRKVACG